MLRSKRLFAFVLVLAMVFSQSVFASAASFSPSSASASAPGEAVVIFYVYDENGEHTTDLPSGLNYRFVQGMLAWSMPSTATMAGYTNVPNNKYIPYAHSVKEPGWYTIVSWGTGFYTFKTYLEVTQEQIDSGAFIEVQLENSVTAGANNHDQGTSINLPSIKDRFGANGNWSTALYTRDVPRPTDGPNGSINASDIANWPDYFALGGKFSVTPDWDGIFYTPALNPANAGTRPLYQWTSQTEMENFIEELAEDCDDMYVYNAGVAPDTFDNGVTYNIPFAVFTTSDLTGKTVEEAGEIIRNNGKATFFHGANIHGNEQSSGEGALAIMYDMAKTEWGEEVIEDINVIVYPRINPTGHTRNNRAAMPVTYERDGKTYTQAQVDMNRDHQVIKTSEIYDLHRAWSLFMPHVSFDGHELGTWTYSGSGTNLSYNNGADMQSTPATALNVESEVTDLAIEMSNQHQADARQAGIRSYHYTGTGTTNNNSIGRAYYGNMNSISILVETRGQSNGLMQRRTYTQYMTSKSFIQSLRENKEKIKSTVDAARQKVIDMGKTYSTENLIHVQTSTNGPDTRLGTIQQFNLNINGNFTLGSAGQVNYAYIPNRARTRPTGYLMPKTISYETSGNSYKISYEQLIEKLTYILDAQRIDYYELPAGTTLPLEQYKVNGAQTNPSNNQFRAELREKSNVTFTDGAIFIPMDQVSGTVIALLMEPDTTDPAGYGGSFVQGLVDTSSNELPNDSQTFLHNPDDENSLPIYRYTENNPRSIVELAIVAETDGNLLLEGDEFEIDTYFTSTVNSNTIVLDYAFDTTKFEFSKFNFADGVGIIEAKATETGARVMLMVKDYNAKNLGNLVLGVIGDLEGKEHVIELDATYVLLENDEKVIKELSTELSVSGLPNRTEFTLLELSDIIDYYGKTSEDPEWNTLYKFWNFVRDGESQYQIDIFDISYVARLVK